jgi:hypothetical protein
VISQATGYAHSPSEDVRDEEPKLRTDTAEEGEGQWSENRKLNLHNLLKAEPANFALEHFFKSKKHKSHRGQTAHAEGLVGALFYRMKCLNLYCK